MGTERTRAALELLFEAGDAPSASDFADLIASGFNLSDDDTADLKADAVTDALYKTLFPELVPDPSDNRLRASQMLARVGTLRSDLETYAAETRAIADDAKAGVDALEDKHDSELAAAVSALEGADADLASDLAGAVLTLEGADSGLADDLAAAELFLGREQSIAGLTITRTGSGSFTVGPGWAYVGDTLVTLDETTTVSGVTHSTDYAINYVYLSSAGVVSRSTTAPTPASADLYEPRQVHPTTGDRCIGWLCTSTAATGFTAQILTRRGRAAQWQSRATSISGAPENFGFGIAGYADYTTSATKTLSTAKVAPAFATALLMSSMNMYAASLPAAVHFHARSPTAGSGSMVLFNVLYTSSSDSYPRGVSQWLEDFGGSNVYGRALAQDVTCWPLVLAVRAVL